MPNQSMRLEYDHLTIDPKWQQKWERREVFRWRNDLQKPKFYVLEMFPYTSGRMHIGHARNYTMGDVLARLKRSMGYDVL